MELHRKCPLSLNSFTPLCLTVHLLPRTLYHTAGQLVVHPLEQVSETFQVTCSKSAFAIVYKTPHASYYQYYIITETNPSRLKGTFKVFHSCGYAVAAQVDGWKKANKSQLWLAFAPSENSENVYSLWTLTDEVFALADLQGSKRGRAALKSPLVQCLSLFQNNNAVIKRRRRVSKSCDLAKCFDIAQIPNQNL